MGLKQKGEIEMSTEIQRGNETRIDPKKKITPRFLTYNIVPKKEQNGNHVPQPPVENTLLAKKEVDANEK